MRHTISIFIILVMINGCISNNSGSHHWITRLDYSMPEPIGAWEDPGPIILWIHPSVSEENRVCFENAVEFFETQTNTNLFAVLDMNEKDIEKFQIYGSASMKSSVLMQTKSQLLEEVVTYFAVNGKGNILDTEIMFNKTLSSRRCKHELGHVLGLQKNQKGNRELLMKPENGTGVTLLQAEIDWLVKTNKFN